MKQNQVLLKNAMIAAVYAVMTIGLAPISYGPVQVRISECMTLLAYYDNRVIPGLVAGCFLANIGSPFGLPDMIIGTAATAVGLYLMRFCPNLLTASLMPVLANGIIIGAELTLLSALPPEISPILAMVYVGLGEFAAVTVIGCVVMKLVMKNESVKAWIEGN